MFLGFMSITHAAIVATWLLFAGRYLGFPCPAFGSLALLFQRLLYPARGSTVLSLPCLSLLVLAISTVSLLKQRIN